MTTNFRYDYTKLNRKQLKLAYGSDIENLSNEIENLKSILNNKNYRKLFSKDKYNELYSKMRDMQAYLDLLVFERDTALI